MALPDFAADEQLDERKPWRSYEERVAHLAASHPARAHRSNNRVLAVEKAEAGASFEARAHEGVVRPPLYVPDIFQDLRGLAVWLSISTFWSNSIPVLSSSTSREYSRVKWPST